MALLEHSDTRFGKNGEIRKVLFLSDSWTIITDIGTVVSFKARFEIEVYCVKALILVGPGSLTKLSAYRPIYTHFISTFSRHRFKLRCFLKSRVPYYFVNPRVQLVLTKNAMQIHSIASSR